jgi:hypothetical protein
VILASTSFRHYGDRPPSWVKLHVDLLDDEAYLELSGHLRGVLADKAKRRLEELLDSDDEAKRLAAARALYSYGPAKPPDDGATPVFHPDRRSPSSPAGAVEPDDDADARQARARGPDPTGAWRPPSTRG